MNERLKQLRKTLSIKQSDFASALSISQGHLSDVENGRKEVSERIINICSLRFNVNEDWLRTGDGEMFNELTEQEETAAFLGKIMRKDMDGNIRQRLIHILSQLSEEEWVSIEKIARQIAANYKDENEKKD